MKKTTRLVMIVIWGVCGFFGGLVGARLAKADRQPLASPVADCKIYAITMDESSFNQLENSDMVQIKILRH